MIHRSPRFSDHSILVCQGLCCQKDGSEKLLTAFKSQTPSDTKIIPSGCLGKCEDSPVVLRRPRKKFYKRVSIEDVPRICNTLS
jgi:(2Fe-2S) ferredoxin